ncbi:MAG: 4Fe-4S binding protein [Thermoplasmatales archaeon]|jgi:ferredoxin|nr:4Fe-4S binding protein [Thermoplasmatales archaeon]MCK5636243.1 4Fe-4S binding protein [Thermoplasmatales archaeon]
MGKPKAMVDRKKCLSCGGCISVCPQDALSMDGMKALVEENKCISCAICIRTCPVGAISGEVYN